MNYLGIDIAKDSFDASFIASSGKTYYARFSNDPTGFREIQAYIKAHNMFQLHVCMEATNVYWQDLAEYLTQKGYRVSVVNPAQIKGFAQSLLARHKTDKVDSQMIALFCQQNNPKAWIPPSPEHKKLRSLVRHLDDLKQTLTQQTNRLQTKKDEEVCASQVIVIDTLKSEIARIELRINDFIEQNPDLKEKRDLLVSIKGIGKTTANKLLAELHDIENYENARAVAADLGLTASQYESGSSVKRKARMSKVGKASIRGDMYWPTITAMTHNPIIKRFKEKLKARGKAKKVIIVAAMRKLMHIVYGVLKNKTPFDPNYAH